MYFTLRAIKNFIVKNWIFERLEKVRIPKISVGKIFGENPRRNFFPPKIIPPKFLVVNVSGNAENVSIEEFEVCNDHENHVNMAKFKEVFMELIATLMMTKQLTIL